MMKLEESPGEQVTIVEKKKEGKKVEGQKAFYIIHPPPQRTPL